MRAIVSRMISTGSLSAFSASATNGIVTGGNVGAAGGIQQAQARSQSAAQPTPPAGQGRPLPPLQPGQTMPRGSLLDLSV